jgi:hypothetical protein
MPHPTAVSVRWNGSLSKRALVERSAPVGAASGDCGFVRLSRTASTSDLADLARGWVRASADREHRDRRIANTQIAAL